VSEVFEMDVNGDGIDDQVVAQEYADGSIVSMADTDGDGEYDIAAYDADGDGVPEEVYDANDYTASDTSYAGDSEASYAADSEPAPASDGENPYADAAASDPNYAANVSDLMAAQHESAMAVINNL
jgi:hypothetical protein